LNPFDDEFGDMRAARAAAQTAGSRGVQAYTSPTLRAFHVCFWGGRSAEWRALVPSSDPVFQPVQSLLSEISRAEGDGTRWYEARERRLEAESEETSRRQQADAQREREAQDRARQQAQAQRTAARNAEREERIQRCVSMCTGRPNTSVDDCRRVCSRQL